MISEFLVCCLFLGGGLLYVSRAHRRQSPTFWGESPPSCAICFGDITPSPGFIASVNSLYPNVLWRWIFDSPFERTRVQNCAKRLGATATAWWVDIGSPFENKRRKSYCVHCEPNKSFCSACLKQWIVSSKRVFKAMSSVSDFLSDEFIYFECPLCRQINKMP